MISIIIPALNEEKWIGKTVRALKSRLTLENEIIVADGGSTDKTVEEARGCADIVVEYRDNKPILVGENRNRGAAAAKGEFLAFIDSGCFITDPDAFFTRALEDFKDPELAALSGMIKVMPELAGPVDAPISSIINNGHWFINEFLGRGSAWGKFMMTRRETFDKLHGFNRSYAAGEDMDFFGRAALIGKTRIDRKLVVYHPNRRANRIGWAHLLFIWWRDAMYRTIFKRNYSKEWKPVR